MWIFGEEGGVSYKSLYTMILGANVWKFLWSSWLYCSLDRLAVGLAVDAVDSTLTVGSFFGAPNAAFEAEGLKVGGVLGREARHKARFSPLSPVLRTLTPLPLPLFFLKKFNTIISHLIFYYHRAYCSSSGLLALKTLKWNFSADRKNSCGTLTKYPGYNYCRNGLGKQHFP